MSRMSRKAMIAAVAVIAVSAAGCGSPAPEAPTSGAPGVAVPVVHGYSFKPGMVKGNAVPTALGGKVFSRIEAVVSVPSTPGPHPVAFIFPGSFPTCITKGQNQLVTEEANTLSWPQACDKPGRGPLASGPDYLRASASMAYLGEELARRGIASISIEVGAKEQWWTGEVDAVKLQNALLKTHKSVLADFNAGRNHGLTWAKDLKGRLDLSRTALVGHSSGGEFVLHQELGKAPLPGLKGVVALEPASNWPYPKGGKAVATLVVAGQCDEQVGPAGPISLAKELAGRDRGVPVVAATMSNTTHIGMLAGGGNHKLGTNPVESPSCADGALAPSKQIQGATALLTADFLDGVLGAQPTITLRTVKAVRVSAEVLGGSTKVALKGIATAPEATVPNRITFDDVNEQLVPALPKNFKLLRGAKFDSV